MLAAQHDGQDCRIAGSGTWHAMVFYWLWGGHLLGWSAKRYAGSIFCNRRKRDQRYRLDRNVSIRVARRVEPPYVLCLLSACHCIRINNKQSGSCLVVLFCLHHSLFLVYFGSTLVLLHSVVRVFAPTADPTSPTCRSRRLLDRNESHSRSHFDNCTPTPALLRTRFPYLRSTCGTSYRLRGLAAMPEEYEDLRIEAPSRESLRLNSRWYRR